jgi:hypothetical protein
MEIAPEALAGRRKGSGALDSANLGTSARPAGT